MTSHDVLEHGTVEEVRTYLAASLGSPNFRRVGTRIELVLPAAAASIMSDHRNVEERDGEIRVTFPVVSRWEFVRTPRNPRLHARPVGSDMTFCGLRSASATRIDDAEGVDCRWCLCREIALEIAAPAGPTPPMAPRAAPRLAELRGAWREILDTSRVSTPREAEVLAAHPQLDACMGELRGLLTSPLRFVAFEDGMYNRIRAAYLKRDRGTDEPKQVTIYAWDQLLQHVATKQFRSGTAWTRTISMLDEGADEGMRQIRGLEVRLLGRVGRVLVSGPYARACKTGR